MLFALCLLLSSSQLTSLSPIPFSIFSDKFPAKFSNENLLMTRDPRKLVTPFPVTLELKIKNKGK